MKLLLALLSTLALAGCQLASTTTTSSPTTTAPTQAVSTGWGTNCHAVGTGLYALPDPHCTPGATNPDVTQATIGTTICKPGYSASIRPPASVTGPEKLESMKAYGITGSPHPYEFDHLISLELGGAPNSPQNLWPELDYPGSGHGFFLNPKDHLEDALHSLVCSGKMPLAEAQNIVANNWPAGLKEYG